MFRNYLKISFRNIIRQKLHSLINILGLSISLTVVFLLLLWINDEWSTDKFHVNSDRLYQVKRTIPLEGNALHVYASVSYPMLQAAAEEFPEVERYIPIGRTFEDNLQIEDHVVRASGTFANAAYFQAFSFPVLQGDMTQLDKKIDAMVVSESLAKRLFGESWKTSTLGKTVHIHDNGDFTIEAVFTDLPDASSLKNDFLYSFEAHLKANEWMHEWTNNGMQGALLLADENTNPNIVGDKLEKLFQPIRRANTKKDVFFKNLKIIIYTAILMIVQRSPAEELNMYGYF